MGAERVDVGVGLVQVEEIRVLLVRKDLETQGSGLVRQGIPRCLLLLAMRTDARYRLPIRSTAGVDPHLGPPMTRRRLTHSKAARALLLVRARDRLVGCQGGLADEDLDPR